MKLVPRKEFRGTLLAMLGLALTMKASSHLYIGWVAFGVFCVGCARIYFKVVK